MRHQFDLRGVGPGILQGLHLAPKTEGLLKGFSDRPVARPSGVAGNHPEMPDNGQAFARHGFHDQRTGRTINRTGPQFHSLEADADGFFRRCQAMGRGRRYEAGRGGLHEEWQTGLALGRIETAAE